MLEHEDEVEYHGDDGEQEFDDVESIAASKIDKLLVLVPVVEALLSERERATCEVQKHVDE